MKSQLLFSEHHTYQTLQHLSDILILGAGPAGTSAALFLAKQGIASTIVDKAVFPRDKICGDALSGKVVEVLRKLDEQLIAEIAADKTFLGSWGVTFVAPNGNALRVPFTGQPEKRKHAPGFIATRLNFDDFLFRKAKNQPLITAFENTEIRQFQKTPTGFLATDKTGNEFHTKLVLACDGAYSVFAKDIAQLATEPQHNCFGLRAYYKNVAGLDGENFIELHFMQQALPGYFWIFPLPDGKANVGIGMRADKQKAKNINLKKLFEEIIATHPTVSKRFGNAELVDGVKLFGLPLGSKKRKLSGDNFILCGDAAMLIDPFTGEGIGNALMSGMFAAQQAAKCLQQNNFSATFMKQYDEAVYHRLWHELKLSYRLQQLVNFPKLFNLVVNKANRSPQLRTAIMSMFEDLDLRAQLKNPLYYLRILFS